MALRECVAREMKFTFGEKVIAGQEWRHGEPTRNVLLLHGWQDNSNSFSKLANLLPQDWWLVALDFPGHGLSSQRPEGSAYYVTDWLLDVRIVIRNLGWKTFTIIGHSMGAGVALTYAALFPDSVEAVVALDIVKQISDVPGTTVKVLRNAVIALTEFDDVEKRPKEVYSSRQEAEDGWYEKHKNNMTKEDVKIILDRGLRHTENGKFEIIRDPRLILPPLFRVPLDQHRQLMSELKCDLLITKSLYSPSWESPEIEKEFLDMYKKNCSKFNRVEIDGLHHVHVAAPEKIACEIMHFLPDKH